MEDMINYLSEIRKRLIVCIFTFIMGTIIAFVFVDRVVDFLKAPAENLILIYVSPPEALLANIRIAAICGATLAMPMVIYQFIAFLYPALYPSERKLVIPMITLSLLLFALGISFAYYIVYPFVIGFFLEFARKDLLPYFTISSYLSFISNTIFSFGLIFQLPCIFWFLGKIRILKAGFLRKHRKYAVLIILIISAIITPPDVLSQILLSVPLFILYEIGILFVVVSQWGNKKNDK